MIGLVVTGHGHFADGIHTSAQMIAGENDYVRYINFEEGMTPEQLAEKFNAAFDEFKSCDGPMTKWAGYLADGAPKENERPAAYIAVLGDSSIKSNKMYEVEAGAAVTTMMLEAVEMGLGTCWLGAIQRDEIKKLLKLDENLDVVYLLAVGYPKQESKIVDMKDNDVKYYEDENGVINVPKRSLEEILIK